jgi:hypothetical protein
MNQIKQQRLCAKNNSDDTYSNHRNRKRYISILLILSCLLSLNVYGQGRSFIKKQMAEQNNCRNVAITKTNGNLMLYGRNGWAGSGLPARLSSALTELHDENSFIDDVQLTEKGRWLILNGNNGFQWEDIPSGLERQLKRYNNDNEVVNSVTFNDSGDWIIISEDYYNASSEALSEWLEEGNERHGELWAACITEDAIVAVFARGYKFYGNVPEGLKKALRKTELNVFRLKIAGTAWFIADRNGNYECYM